MSYSKAAIKKYINKRSIRDFHILCVKGPDATADVDADDPDYFGEQLPLNTGEYTITGAAAGDYVLTLLNSNGQTLASVTYTAGGGDAESDVAEGISDAINAALLVAGSGEVLARYIDSSSYAAGDEFSIRWASTRVRTTAVLTVPGGTWTPQSAADSTGTCGTWPRTREIPHVDRGGEGQNIQAEVTVVGVTAAGVPVAPQGTYSMQFLQEVLRADDAGEASPSIANRGEVTGANIGDVHSVAMNGGLFGVRMHTIAGESGSVDRWEIQVRAVVT